MRGGRQVSGWGLSVLGVGVVGAALAGGGLLRAGAPATGASGPPGVTDSEIMIGSCSALEGPSQTLGAQTVAGAKAYFSLIN